MQYIYVLPFLVPKLGSQGTSEGAAKDIAAFIAIFFENFPAFQGRALHMAGESYAVRIFLSFCHLCLLTEGTLCRDGIFHSSLLPYMTRMPCSLKMAQHR